MSTETRARATIAGFAMLARAARAAGGRRRGGCGGGSGTTAPPNRRRRGRRPAHGHDRALPAADRRLDLDLPRRRSGRGLRQAERGRGLRGHGRRHRRHDGLQGARDGQGGDPAHLVRADGDRRPPPPRSARRRHRPPAVRRVVFAVPAARRRGARPPAWRARPGRSTTRTPRPPAASRPRRPTSPRPGRSTRVDVVTAVPAGTFNALKVTRTDTADGSTKTQWFVRGVGKIRERTGAGHIEELTAYTIAP